jgi:hypothetical protein
MTMNRWNEIPPADHERIQKTLAALEEAFRPMAETLSFEDEPATTFDAGEDAE